MNVFQIVKENLDMPTVASYYGLEINRSGMARCPFHDEKTPSAKIYKDNFHCFGCGEHLDVIAFVQKLFNLSRPIEAVKKLNQDFALHIDLDKPMNCCDVSELQKRKAEREQYKAWENNAWRLLNSYCKTLRSWQEIYAPKNPNEEQDKRFVYALQIGSVILN